MILFYDDIMFIINIYKINLYKYNNTRIIKHLYFYKYKFYTVNFKLF